MSPSSVLAKVIDPTRLKAEMRIGETQAKDIALGQFASIAPRNGVISGSVVRFDPAPKRGTLLVDIALAEELPKGTRPNLNVDGVIEIERLIDVLFVGKMVHGQADSTVGLFRVLPDGSHAERVPVKLGRRSVSTIEVLELGDEVILSDMSSHGDCGRVRLL